MSKKLREEQRRKIKQEADRKKLLKSVGRSPDGKPIVKERKEGKLVLPPCGRSPAQYKSAGLAPIRIADAQLIPEDSDAREAVAQVEIECKKKRVGVLVNKGAYQYITDETDPSTIGR